MLNTLPSTTENSKMNKAHSPTTQEPKAHVLRFKQLRKLLPTWQVKDALQLPVKYSSVYVTLHSNSYAY